VLLSLGPVTDKYWFCEEARIIADELKLPIYATTGTAEMLAQENLPCKSVGKHSDDEHTAMELIDKGVVDLVINIPREFDQYGRPDDYLIRRRAVDLGVPLITDLQLARAVVEALRRTHPEQIRVVAWNDYLSRESRPL
jgi:carbamoyl-phosphate synthase large subunit